MDRTIKKKKWAEDWLGIPYESSGRSLKGLDCWGLVYCLYKNLFGIELPKIDKEYIKKTSKPVNNRIILRKFIIRKGWK